MAIAIQFHPNHSRLWVSYVPSFRPTERIPCVPFFWLMLQLFCAGEDVGADRKEQR